jgi:hypothetical protein
MEQKQKGARRVLAQESLQLQSTNVAAPVFMEVSKR